ncbi:uncharacterized protein PV06_10896 [Exophiala oligosperma]|uniref:Low affinity iron permease n=1 Tax=Exophiala oligosperma TaxID=215243 RepID=A0A0D2D158_9EURO|nr:uncharacterized protein PV06_10896 [Exophiala oligosperma]KIW36998.1 hypothetical protein PV06_10896 [Exophiala oligosperma]
MLYFRILEALSAPGSRKPVTVRATAQIPEHMAVEVSSFELGLEPEAVSSVRNHAHPLDEGKPRLLDRWLDVVVAASGSSFALLATIAIVLLWAIMGVRYGGSEDWQVVISDVQAVFCYVFDSLLMRQQLNSYESSFRLAASFQSRAVGTRRMLRQLKSQEVADHIPAGDIAIQHNSMWSTRIPRDGLITRAILFTGRFLSHVVTLTMFWVCIFIWLGFGCYCDWSVRWQLYINSATSALMMICFAMIACIRELNRARTNAHLLHISQLDEALEFQLRQMTGDTDPNAEITIYPCKVNRLHRAISYYADLVGTLVGIVLLMTIVVVWVAIGPSLHFSSSWWLIIGTYAGLIGMHDGFVLHNLQSQLNQHRELAMAEAWPDDVDNLAVIGLTAVRSRAATNTKVSIARWLSCRLSYICAHEYAVILGIILIVGLVVAATALKWSVTGQLLCNIPPSIIETFIMMALITSQSLDEATQREHFEQLEIARETLKQWVARVGVVRIEENDKAPNVKIETCTSPAHTETSGLVAEDQVA